MDLADSNVHSLSEWVMVKVGDENTRFRLRWGVNSIGRHSASDLTIDSTVVSRHHAEISIDLNQRFYIELRDLNSINGTYINNRHYRADTEMLHEGDMIGFGAEYDEEDAAQLPIYRLKFEPENPSIRHVTAIQEILSSDDDVRNDEIHVQPVKEDAAQLPINRLQFEPANPSIRHITAIQEIFSSDDDVRNDEIDVQPVKEDAAQPIEEDAAQPVEEDAAQFPIYSLKFEPSNASKNQITPVQEIFSSDDDDLNNEIDVKPVIFPEPAERTAISNILTIFGNADETILDSLQRINPKVCEAVRKASNAELVVLSSSSDDEDDDPDDNQLIYSQALIDEMKSEMVDESNEADNQTIPGDTADSAAKQASLSPTIISLTDDDDEDVNSDDFDEDLEEKVSTWKNLLFCSQIYPKMNCSQAIISDNISDDYSSHNDSNQDSSNDNKKTEKTAVASEDSIIENLFQPLEKKLDKKKRTLEEKSNVNDEKDSPVVRKKKRKLMKIVDESDSEEHNEVPCRNLQEEASEQTPEKSLSKVEIRGTSVVHSKSRGPTIISPPFLKYGRRKSNTVTPKPDSKGFLEKRRHKKIDSKLKEMRKECLKSISANKTNENIENTKKRQEEESAKRRSKSTTTKVKNTMNNRGAFLCEIGETSTSVAAKNQSKTHQTPTALNNTNNTNSTTTTNSSALTTPPPHLDFFAQDISNLGKCIGEVRKIIRKNAEKARARNAPKKLRFAEVEKREEERRKSIASKLNAIVTSSTVIVPSTTDTVIPYADVDPTADTIKKKPKKTVRFNDVPTIYYFESNCEFSRKVDRKDLMPRLSYRHRRTMIRRTFPTVDRTDNIISLILAYSNEWLTKQSTAIAALTTTTTQNISAIPTTFESFEHYKRVFFPLMKLEYMSSLERETKVNFKVKPANFVLEDIINNKERILLVIKCINGDEPQISKRKCDLVLLRIGELKTKTFGYMVSCRKSGASAGGRDNNRIFVEILFNSVNADYLRNSKTISIQPTIDNLQVTIGAYNAIHQLEACPLYEMILSPNLLLKASNELNSELDYEVSSKITHDQLNPEQLNAVKEIYKKICFNKTETTSNLSIIQGPPGTGKSVVVVNLALQILYGLGGKFRNKKILICAQSNCAIDAVAAKLLEARGRIQDKSDRFFFVRFGIFEKMHPKVHPVSLHNMLEFERVKKLNHFQFTNVADWTKHLQRVEEELKTLQLQVKSNIEVQAKLDGKKRELELLHYAYKNALSAEDEHNICKIYLGKCNIVCTTLSSCVKLFQYIDYFDICIIDEATQCTEPWTLLPMKFGISSLVLVGDSQQLPATVLSKQAADYGLTRSLLTRIENNIVYDSHSSNRTNERNIIFSLRVQYRMHPEICKFPNSYFYKNFLRNAENTLEHITPLMPYSVFNLEYAQNESSMKGKIINPLEADFVVELLKALNELIPIDKNSYGVITPYAHQRKVLAGAIENARLPHVTVNTIDSYQGVEKDVIVISNARTNGVGFLANPQRLNVAITRPKKCLILCGNFRNLQRVPAWRCLLKNAQERNLYHEIGEFDISDIKTKVIQRILAKK